MRHFRNTARVVGNGAVSVGRQRDAERGEHADGGKADAEQAEAEARAAARHIERGEHGRADDQNGNQRGLHAQRNSAYDDRCRAGSCGACHPLGMDIGVGGVVFGVLADQDACGKPGYDGKEDADALFTEHEPDQNERGDDDQHGAGVYALSQRGEQRFLLQLFAGTDKERADDGGDNADGSHRHWDNHALYAKVCGNRERRGGNDGTDIRFVKVGAHARYVANIVANVIRDNGGIAGVVFRNARFEFANEVGADVRRFGKDAAANAGKQRHGGSAHAKRQHGGGNALNIEVEAIGEQVVPDGKVEKSEAYDGKAHDAARGEGDAQALVETLARGKGGSGVGRGCNAHADKARQRGEHAARDERKRDERVDEVDAAQREQDGEHNRKEQRNSGVLTLEVDLRALFDRGGELGH